MAEAKRVKVGEVFVGLGSEEWSVPSGTTVKEVIQMIISLGRCSSSSEVILEAHVDQDGSVFRLPDTFKLTEIEGWRYKARAEVFKPRRFATGVAIQDPTECFFIEPQGAQALADDLVAGHYCVVCDRRQSGKTTLLFAVSKRLEKSGLVPVYIGGLSSAAKGWTSSDMWGNLCRRLHLACPALFAEQEHGRSDDIVFMTMFRKTVLSCKVVVILDEADTLLKLDPGCLDVFFHTIKDMKSQRASYNLWAFVLAGVETIKDLLEAQYDRRRQVALAANEEYLASATPSRLSPFPHDFSQALRPFTVEDLISLMEQANKEHEGKIEQVVEVATHIWQQTLGHKGLVGTCLAYMMQEEAFTFKSWLELSDSFKLGRHLFGQATYARIMSFFRKTSTISQALYNLLVSFLEQEKRELQSVVHLRDLLAEGVLTAVPEDNKYQVSISSPLLRTTILRRCSIYGQQVDDPPAPRRIVNRTWVVQQAIRTLDYDCICRPECSLASGEYSEYSHQFIFMCRVKAVMQSAYPFVGAVLPEVKEVPVEGVRRSQLRLDTLVCDHQHFPRFGFEYVVDGDVKNLRAHYEKSIDYSKQHSAQVYLINFTLRKDPLEIEPDDDSIYFWGVRFDPEDQTATVISLDATGARETTVLSLRNWTGKFKFDDIVG